MFTGALFVIAPLFILFINEPKCPLTNELIQYGTPTQWKLLGNKKE